MELGMVMNQELKFGFDAYLVNLQLDWEHLQLDYDLETAIIFGCVSDHCRERYERQMDALRSG